jgi:hypothetical protein
LAKAKEKAAPKKRRSLLRKSKNTDLSSDELISMSIGKKPHEKKTDNGDNSNNKNQKLREKKFYSKQQYQLGQKCVYEFFYNCC